MVHLCPSSAKRKVRIRFENMIQNVKVQYLCNFISCYTIQFEPPWVGFEPMFSTPTERPTTLTNALTTWATSPTLKKDRLNSLCVLVEVEAASEILGVDMDCRNCTGTQINDARTYIYVFTQSNLDRLKWGSKPIFSMPTLDMQILGWI